MNSLTQDKNPGVSQRVLVVALERLGWSLLSAELSLVADTARIELRRNDGLTVTLDVRNGRGSLTREMVERETVCVGRRGDRCRVERIKTRFLGRSHCGAGPRSALRMLADYVGDNSTGNRLEAREAFRLLLGASA